MCEETLRSSMHCSLLEVEAVRRAGDALATRASVILLPTINGFNFVKSFSRSASGLPAFRFGNLSSLSFLVLFLVSS